MGTYTSKWHNLIWIKKCRNSYFQKLRIMESPVWFLKIIVKNENKKNRNKILPFFYLFHCRMPNLLDLAQINSHVHFALKFQSILEIWNDTFWCILVRNPIRVPIVLIHLSQKITWLDMLKWFIPMLILMKNCYINLFL